MLNKLKPVVYIQISPDRLTLKNVKTGDIVDEVPELAVGGTNKLTVLAVGTEAKSSAATQAAALVNPFAHPRSLVSDFTMAEQLLKRQLRRLLGRSLFAVSPCIVVHPLGSPAGGFTQVERRAFREMAFGAGASEVHVWSGRPLTDGEVLQRHPPAQGEWD